MIRILLLIRSPVLRAGLRSLLDDLPEVEVRASERPAEEAFLLGETDVVVTDHLGTAAAAFGRLTGAADGVPGLLLITDDPPELASLAAMAAGAWGVLPLDADLDEIVSALQALQAGLVVGLPEAFTLALRPARDGAPAAGEEILEPLTPREEEVLHFLARGLANKQIAAELAISEHTVKFHVSSIYGKLGASNRAEAVRLGLQHGLISL